MHQKNTVTEDDRRARMTRLRSITRLGLKKKMVKRMEEKDTSE